MRIAVVNAGSATVEAALADVDGGGARVVERSRRDVDPGKVAGAFEEVLDEVGALPGDVAGVAHRIAHASLVEALAEAQGGALRDVTAVTHQLGGGSSIRGGLAYPTTPGHDNSPGDLRLGGP
jgi:hypothetical protein